MSKVLSKYRSSLEIGQSEWRGYARDTMRVMIKEANLALMRRVISFSYENIVADDLRGLEFSAELDPDWQTKLRTGRNRPARSTVSTTQGTFRTGVAEFTDAERTCLAQMIEAFDAEPFRTTWGYMPE